MLKQIDFSAPPLTKEEYKSEYEELIERLVVLQQQAHLSEVGIVVLFEGWNGAGKGSRLSDLLYNLDARFTQVAVTEDFNSKEAQHYVRLKERVSGPFPAMQEFWKALGPRGGITFFVRGWYTRAVQSLLFTLFGSSLGGRKHRLKKKQAKAVPRLLEQHLFSMREFEQQLTNEGYRVLKFFLHISEEVQKQRLTELREDPTTRWRVSKQVLERTKNYKESLAQYESLLTQSNFDFAPWIVLNGEDKRRANLEIARALVVTLEASLAERGLRKLEPGNGRVSGDGQDSEDAQGSREGVTRAKRGALSNAEGSTSAIKRSGSVAEVSVTQPIGIRPVLSKPLPSLDSVARDLSLGREEYKEQLRLEQERLNRLELEMYLKRIPLMLLFEGWDAAGKGGAIKRVAQALDARAYTIFPSPAPTANEKLHPHLWRYWTRLPKAGHVGLYDRSWYGRVLVERVEGIASRAEWCRAYDEINGFEYDLVAWGALLIKFWVEISPEEQLRRFEEREADPSKNWKITEEDWRNRAKYAEYRAAAEEMFSRTSTVQAPWIILEGEDKYHARVKALQIINDALEARFYAS